MGFISWIIVGAIAGWIATKIMKKDDKFGLGGNILIGVVGGSIGGFVMNFFNKSGATGFNIHSILVSVLGACILLYAIDKFKS